MNRHYRTIAEIARQHSGQNPQMMPPLRHTCDVRGARRTVSVRVSVKQQSRRSVQNRRLCLIAPNDTFQAYRQGVEPVGEPCHP